MEDDEVFLRRFVLCGKDYSH